MKKTIMLLILLVLTLTSCQWWSGGEEEPIDEADETTEDAEEETVDEAEDTTYERDVTVITESSEAIIEFYDRVDMDTATIVFEHEDYYTSSTPGYQSFEEHAEWYIEYAEYWKAGTFLSGPYEGQTLVIANPVCDGMCISGYYRFAADLDNDEWTLLVPYSTSSGEGVTIYPYKNIDENVQIAQLDVSESLDIYEQDRVSLSSKVQVSKEELIEAGAEEIILNDDSFEKYLTLKGCIYGVYPDGITAKYSVTPEEFLETESYIKGLTIQTVDGDSYEKEYMLYPGGGCGFITSCLQQYELDETSKTSLVKVGQIEGGREVFTLDNFEEDNGQDDTIERSITTIYDGYKIRFHYGEDVEGAMTAQEFLDENAVLIMPLDNGKYTIISDSEYALMAECGKPVIYLYPEEETVANVQVGIDEFTVTDPVYGEDGWNVIAQPDGTLTNLADGQEYPYLFWEGNSDKTIPLEPGFTLSKKAVIKQLPSVLQDLGLNEIETADFMEFWLPKLLAENGKYIEFTFAPQELFDQVAPLTITPEPDQVIRVFMLYQGTNEPGLPVPDFNTPKRYGFTVVEWGGDLH